MTYQQVRDVVKLLRRSHQQLRDALEQHRSRSQDSRTRLMLEALRREEQQLQIALARYDAQGQEALLDTWLQYVPDEELRQAQEAIEFTPDMTAEEVVVRKLTYDQALLDLLGQLCAETSVPRVQEFFCNLRDNVESRTAGQVWSVRDFEKGEDPPAAE
jgi:hypothetical protein